MNFATEMDEIKYGVYSGVHGISTVVVVLGIHGYESIYHTYWYDTCVPVCFVTIG